MTNSKLPFERSILEEMERTRKLYMQQFSGVESALNKLYQQHLHEIQPMIEAYRSLPMEEIFRANQQIQKSFQQTGLTNYHFEEFVKMHKSWLDIANPARESMAMFQSTLQAALSDIAPRLAISERLLAEIDFESIRRAIAPPDIFVDAFDQSLIDIKSSYANLVGSLPSLTKLTRLPSFTLPSASRELFTNAYAAEAISQPEEIEIEEDDDEKCEIAKVQEETSNIIALLRDIDPALATPYLGAYEAFHSNNIDKARHIITSLRELWVHLFRKIAPDEQVGHWIPTNSKDYLHLGKPTRRARILYVCRNLNHDPLNDFVDKDTQALVGLFDLFQRLHELESKFTDRQLRALLLRSDSQLFYILQIYKEV